jgi:K+-transporting ATPase ATPase C chain
MRNYLRQLPTALRMLVVLTVVLGVLYPLVVTLVAQLPGLKSRADGSLVTRDGAVVGSSLLGQPFTDAQGRPVLRYFQPRPSAAGDGYDPTATSASNLGPESILDSGPDARSLLSQVCTRSADLGRTYDVDGSRPYCADGTGAVLAVFYAEPGYHGAVTRVVSVDQFCPTRPFLATYDGVTVQCAQAGADYADGRIVPVRGSAPAHPAVPSDAVTSSGSGLDPDISPAFARLQEAVVARERGLSVAQVDALVHQYTDARDLGFLGEPRVNVLQLNLALDRAHPA